VKFDRIETRKRLADLSRAELYRSIQLAESLAAFHPPLADKLVLLDYAHDLRKEMDRKSAAQEKIRSLSEFHAWELRRSIDYTIELATMCPRLGVSKMLAEYISSLVEELDSRTSKVSADGSKQHRRKSNTNDDNTGRPRDS